YSFGGDDLSSIQESCEIETKKYRGGVGISEDIILEDEYGNELKIINGDSWFSTSKICSAIMGLQT
ncbi:MAG: hypothetical protein P8P37_02765, partial [Candidatus Marinimicrobia bacterium]|nr:hypothetical protein [Candidatus Neomarinimicrobiota bacterium]